MRSNLTHQVLRNRTSTRLCYPHDRATLADDQTTQIKSSLSWTMPFRYTASNRSFAMGRLSLACWFPSEGKAREGSREGLQIGKIQKPALLALHNVHMIDGDENSETIPGSPSHIFLKCQREGSLPPSESALYKYCRLSALYTETWRLDYSTSSSSIGMQQ